MRTQVHLAKAELEYWFREGLVLTWGNDAQPEDFKAIVIDIARNVLGKVFPPRPLALLIVAHCSRLPGLHVHVPAVRSWSDDLWRGLASILAAWTVASV